MNVLLKVSGSISAYKLCEVVSSLKKLGHNVKIAASKSSLEFVGAATWEGLSGNLVFLDDFSPGQRMEHIHLNEWADVVVLAPASAQTMNSISKGVGSSVITTLFLARDEMKPYLIFPAMNPKMWDSTSVQKAVESLKNQKNIEVHAPCEGLMACGHVGVGRLKESSQILDAVLKTARFKKTVLVTLGGTSEGIDGVRKITNFSTGQTGIQLCEFLKKTCKVTAIGSFDALKGAEGLEGVYVQSFQSSAELARLLKQELLNNEYDLVVHAAAVSDFLPIIKRNKKISSDDEFKIEFEKAPKILNEIKNWSLNKSLKVVSFKLTHNQSPEVVFQKIQNQLKDKKSDFVVHNELSKIHLDTHEYSIWEPGNDEPTLQGATKEKMARDIEGLKC